MTELLQNQLLLGLSDRDSMIEHNTDTLRMPV